MRHHEIARLMEGLFGDPAPLHKTGWPELVQSVLELDDQLGREAGDIVRGDQLTLLVTARLLDHIPDEAPILRRVPQRLYARIEAERDKRVHEHWRGICNDTLDTALSVLHSRSGCIYLRRGDDAVLSAYVNWPVHSLKHWRCIPISSYQPLVSAICEGRTISTRHTPSGRPADGDVELDLLILPIAVGGHPSGEAAGALVLTWSAERQHDVPTDVHAQAAAMADDLTEQFTLWQP